MVTSSPTGGSISWARLPVAAKRRIRTVSGATSRRRKDLKKGGLYIADPGENRTPVHGGNDQGKAGEGRAPTTRGWWAAWPTGARPAWWPACAPAAGVRGP